MRDVLVSALAGAMSSCCFGVIFHIRGKKLFFAALCGGVGCLVSALPVFQSSIAAIIWASFSITACSEWMARRLRTPATVFLVAGLIPIVPGGGMYRCMYQALEGDLSQAAVTCYETLLIAGGIAIGVVTVSSLVKVWTGRAQRTSGL